MDDALRSTATGEVPRNSQVAAFDLMILIDAAALSLWLSQWISTMQIILIHLGGVLLCLGLAVLFNYRARLSALMEAGLCLLSGPLGGVILLLTRLGQSRLHAEAGEASDLDDQRNKGPTALPQALYEAHLQGRRSTFQETETQSYTDMLRDGDLPRHNEIIAAISRNYEPEMYPALSLALGSNSPALKVQAAAVYSKLRRTFGESANELLRTDFHGMSPKDATAYHDELLKVARSGFVDAEKTGLLNTRASEIEAMGLLSGGLSGLQGSAAGVLGPQSDIRKQRPRLKRYSCGGVG